VIYRVHRHASRLRALTFPTVATSLADLDQLVFLIADLTDSRPTVDPDPTHLATGKAECREVAFLGDQLHAGTGTASQLATTLGLQFDVVDNGTDRNVAERQGIPGTNFTALARLESVAHLDPLGSENVTLLTIVIVQQENPATAVRVVLKGGHLGRHAVLVTSKVNDPVALLVTTTAMA
jgi:hypothetical protein